MNLYITGFLKDDSVDSSLKYELDVPSDLEQSVMDILGWKDLAEECNGELPLTSQDVQRISTAISQSLPLDLDLFIGVVA
jgi:hypothetical protein